VPANPLVNHRPHRRLRPWRGSRAERADEKLQHRVASRGRRDPLILGEALDSPAYLQHAHVLAVGRRHPATPAVSPAGHAGAVKDGYIVNPQAPDATAEGARVGLRVRAARHVKVARRDDLLPVLRALGTAYSIQVNGLDAVQRITFHSADTTRPLLVS
jgi:hypothetical protein